MSFKTFLVIDVITALVVSSINRAAGWDADFAYGFGMAAMVVMMLICFPFVDFERGFGPRRHRRD